MLRLLPAAARVRITWLFTGCGAYVDQTALTAQANGGPQECSRSTEPDPLVMM